MGYDFKHSTPRKRRRHRSAQATIVTSSSSVRRKSTSVCSRCRELDLESYLHRRKTTPLDATFTKKSIRYDCSICTQLAVFFHEPASAEFEAREHYVIYLTYHDNQNDYPCFTITRAHPSFPIRLIPTKAYSLHGFLSRGISYIPARIVSSYRPDFNLVKNWLRHCQESHTVTCGQMPTHTGLQLKGIDCTSKELALIPPGSPYAALSYLWGDGQHARLTQDQLPTDVPKTVEDSMFVALQLGIPYLWVDRYSIDQSDAAEKHHVIRNMHQVYWAAELTIVACVGADPYYGLPGVRGTPRHPQQTITLDSHKMAVVEPLKHQIQMSRWNSRGWTFQEALLSRRRLVFTESQMYFQCMEEYRMEGLQLEESTVSLNTPYFNHQRTEFYRAFPHGRANWTIVDLYRHLCTYFNKQLSYPSDILNAFEGIFSAFRESQNMSDTASHFWGIPILSSTPVISFAAGLGWHVYYNSKGTPKRKDHGTTFPSWSWASFKARLCDGNEALHIPHRVNTVLDVYGVRNEISFEMVHHSGTRMDLKSFLSHAGDYQSFYPWVNINSWTIQSQIGAKNSLDHYAFLGLEVETIDFDDQDEEWTGKDLLAVHLMTYLQNPRAETLKTRCLLLQEIEPDVFLRVGIWHGYMKTEGCDQGQGIEQLLDKLLSVKGVRLHNGWERRVVSVF